MRRSLATAGVAALALLVASACDSLPGRPRPGAQQTQPQDIIDFSALYGQNCSACHGVDGRGGAAIGLANPVYLTIASDDVLREVVADGRAGTAMPGFSQRAGGMLTDEQIDALVAGMRQRWSQPGSLGGDVPPPYVAEVPGDAARGAEAYTTFCASCHGPDGTGTSKASSIVGPSYLALVSNQQLRTVTIVGRADLGMPDWRGDIPGRAMTSEEISGVVAWLAAKRPRVEGKPNLGGAKAP